MVSLLWKACSDGDIQKVHELLRDVSSVDLEIKDHTGATPLIQAVRNGHVGVVSILLQKGADPTNASSQGRPEQYTHDPAIQELLTSARVKSPPNDMASPGYQHGDGYPQDAVVPKAYYPPPQPSYIYYPAVHPGGAVMSEGGMPYYPPPPPPPPPPSQSQPDTGGLSNLPPPEIARLIPCRYFPACRYGSSCMFAHPQGPYFQGPLPPPAQYSVPYDPMGQPPYAPSYYIATTSYPPNGIHPITSPMSPPPASHHAPTPPLTHHARSASELVSPVQGPFNPPVAPPPVPYGITSPISPSYPQPGQMSVPVGITPLPPIQEPHLPNHHSMPVMYQPNLPEAHGPSSTAGHRRDSSAAYRHGVAPPAVPMGDATILPQSPSLRPQADGYGPHIHPQHREGMGHARRGNPRRSSVAGSSRKPPCLFFPSGRCRNGDDCRFPHIMSDGTNQNSGPYPSKYNSRSRPHYNSGGSLEEKMASMNVQENGGQSIHGHSLETRSSEVGSRVPNGVKANHLTNGVRNDKRNSPRQRIPNADDFPVLAGSTTPPSRSPGPHGPSGPTAAQVLQAPPPSRKDSSKELYLNGDASDYGRSGEYVKEDKIATGINGASSNGPHEPIAGKPSHATFAAVATAASSAPDASSQVPVTA